MVRRCLLCVYINMSLDDDDVEFSRLVDIAGTLTKPAAEPLRLVDTQPTDAAPVNTEPVDAFDPKRVLLANCEKCTPKNMQIVVLQRHFWDKIQDVTYRLRQWPKRTQHLFMKIHKRHFDRLDCAKILLGNGVPPEMIHDLVLKQWDGSRLVQKEQYDTGAVKDVENVIKEHRQMFQSGKWRYFDVREWKLTSW